jgi:predicted amidohydrolase YtcJ
LRHHQQVRSSSHLVRMHYRKGGVNVFHSERIMNQRSSTKKDKTRINNEARVQTLPVSKHAESTRACSNSTVNRRRFVKLGTVAIGSVGLCISELSATTYQGSQEVTVFKGGSVLTVDREFSVARAFAIKGNKILAVGSEADVRAAAGGNAKIVDLQGKVVLPGFVEAHAHPISGAVLAATMTNVGISRFETTEQVLAELRKVAASTPAGDWVMGSNFDPSIQEGPSELTFGLLDKVTTDHPVFVLNASGHLAYANRLAFEAAGIDEDVQNLPGAEYSRDSSNKLNGVIKNNTAWLPVLFSNPVMEKVKPAEAVIQLGKKFNRVGLTTISELAFGGISQGPGDIEILRRLAGSGELTMRVRAYALSNYEAAWDKGDVIDSPGLGNELVRLCGYKMIADGSNQGYTGLQRQPYLNSNNRTS